MSNSNGDRVIIKQNYEQSLHGKRRQKTIGCLLGRRAEPSPFLYFTLQLEGQYPAEASILIRALVRLRENPDCVIHHLLCSAIKKKAAHWPSFPYAY